MVTLDLTKIFFNSVCHERLLIKLQQYGFRGKGRKLIDSYLSNRKLYVCVVLFHFVLHSRDSNLSFTCVSFFSCYCGLVNFFVKF